MKRSAHSSKTSLTGVNVIGDDEKPSLSIVLAGESPNLGEAQRLLQAKFPKAYIEMKRNELQCIMPMQTTVDSPSVSDIVEQVFNETQCGLGFHYNLMVHPHGSKFVPEVTIELEHPHSQDSLLGRSVMDVIERKLDITKTDDPMHDYVCIRSPDGTSLSVKSASEICDFQPQALHYGAVMMSHFRHRLDVAAHTIRRSAVEHAFIEKQPAGSPPREGICIVLSGNEEELRRAHLSMGKGNHVKCELESGDPGKNNATLRINKPLHGLDEVCDMIRMVHLSTGCKLPVSLGSAVFTDEPDPGKVRAEKQTFQPGVALSFDASDTEYNPLFVRALGAYIASYLNADGKISHPVIPSVDGDGYMLNLQQPSAIIVASSFDQQDEAKDKAQQMVKRLKPILEFDSPASDIRI